MNLHFSYYMPTRIIFGCGKLSELKTTPYLPGKKALVVIGASGAMRKHGYLDRVIKYLKENGVDIPQKERPMAFITGLKKLIGDVGLEEERLADFGIKREDLAIFAENSFYTMGSLYDITPVELKLDDVLAIYENAYA